MRQSRVVRPLLASALQLWLRSLVARVDDLDINIQASDRQLLGGHLPQVSLKAEGTVYEGLYLSQVALEAGGIRVNLRQILRGQPFKLADPITVRLQAWVSAEDLNRSLGSEKLSTALATLLQQILPQAAVQVTHIDLAANQLTFQGKVITLEKGKSKAGAPAGQLPNQTLARESIDAPVILSTQVTAQASTLHFEAVQLLAYPGSALPQLLPDQALPLGDVRLEVLDIRPEAIALVGEIKVLP